MSEVLRHLDDLTSDVAEVWKIPAPPLLDALHVERNGLQVGEEMNRRSDHDTA